ncbi:DJ-1/PfpI family protein [Vagococcus elongatus]
MNKKAGFAMVANKKALVFVYDGMSLSEIALLTDFLTAFQSSEHSWKIDTVSSKNPRMIKTEDSFQIIPNKIFSEIDFMDYQVIIFSGIIDPYSIANDLDLINFIKPLANLTDRPLIAAISSAPMLLAKAEILKGVKFTSGLFEEALDEFDFFDKANIIRKPVVYDEKNNIVTAIGFAYREFAVKVAELLGFENAERRLAGVRTDRPYTDEELTFYKKPQ